MWFIFFLIALIILIIYIFSVSQLLGWAIIFLVLSIIFYNKQ